MDKEKKSKSGFYGYLKKIIPSGAIIDFVFYEDFDGDGLMEGIIGFTEFIPFPPHSSIIYIKQTDDKLTHIELLSQIIKGDTYRCGIYDNAAAVEIDSDGYCELVVSLSYGNAHFITIFVFDFCDGIPKLVWQSTEDFLHGSMEVMDCDNDGIFEIIADSGTFDGKDIIALDEAIYHVRKSSCFKWSHNTFNKCEHLVRMPYRSYNIAVSFLMHLWKNEFDSAYEMVLMPGFMGLRGLDDCSKAAFKKYVSRTIMRVLKRNIAKKKLIPSEPYDDFCLFCGLFEDVALEFVKKDDKILIQCVNIYKKS